MTRPPVTFSLEKTNLEHQPRIGDGWFAYNVAVNLDQMQTSDESTNRERKRSKDMTTDQGDHHPIPNSYWVIPGRLAAGEYPGSRRQGEASAKLRDLLDAGIDHFVDLTHPGELVPYGDTAELEARNMGIHISRARFPIYDGSIPEKPEDMMTILDNIDQAIAADHRVYVHCMGGIGRTGTVIGCWLVRHDYSGVQALERLAELWKEVEKYPRRPHTPETGQQRQYILEWNDNPAANLTVERDRFRGCLVGLATGDALGTTLEFRPPGTFEPIRDMVGGGPFRLKPGQWTDDTSMALCLATSLIEQASFDAKDQMERYVRWRREGYLSSTGRCFDIGNTTAEALSRYTETGEPYSGPTGPMSAGNGSLMRLAPVPMYFAKDAAQAIDRSADSSRTTHGAEEAVDACRYFAGLIVGALKGIHKEILLAPGYSPTPGGWADNPLAPAIAAVADGSFKERDQPEIKGTGYVVDTLEAALWAFHGSENFRDGALRVVNLGDDADTTGAVYGQIAGAYYGTEAIPAEWRERLTMVTKIISLADSLHERSRS